MKTADQKGQLALLSLLIIGAITMAAALSASFIGRTELGKGFRRSQLQEALVLADSCTEEALRRLKSDPQFQEAAINFEDEKCQVAVFYEAADKIVLYTTSQVGKVVKKLETHITRSGGNLIITDQKEMPDSAWLQTKWDEASAASVSHYEGGQNDWTKYSSKNENMELANGDNDLQAGQVEVDWLQTNDTVNQSGFKFPGYSASNTEVSGSGSGASVKLARDTSSGTGEDGPLDLSVGCSRPDSSLVWQAPNCIIYTNIRSAFNFTTINIPAGTALTASGSGKIILYATGTVTINGTINLNASGKTAIAGGGNGGNGESKEGCIGRTAGVGVGPGGIGGGGAGGSAGGGGGFGANGTNGQNAGDGGSLYGSITDVFYGGSGGGGGPADCGGTHTYNGYAGGGGGGSLRIASGNSITIGSTGSIQANGANGGGTENRQGGGGAGGGILLQAQSSIANSGFITVKGGIGPVEGGDGAGGRVRLETPTGANITGTTVVVSSCTNALGTINVCGGSTNAGTGSSGSYSYIAYFPTGTFISGIFNTGQGTDFTTVQWNPPDSSQPANTFLKVLIAASKCPNGKTNPPDCNDSGDWVYKGINGTSPANDDDVFSGVFADTYQNCTQVNPCTIYSGHDGDQYVRYKVYLKTTDSAVTPSLDDISIKYKYYLTEDKTIIDYATATDYLCEGSSCPSANAIVINDVAKLKGTPSGTPPELAGTESGLQALYHLNTDEGKELNGPGDAGVDDAEISDAVGLWHLNENTGQTISDSKGTSNGVRGPTSGSEASDPSWSTAGKFSNALSFDGANDYAQINDNAPPLDVNYNTTDANYITDGYAVSSDPAKIEFSIPAATARLKNQATLAEISAPQANLQGLWHLNENTGTTTEDTSGNSNTGYLDKFPQNGNLGTQVNMGIAPTPGASAQVYGRPTIIRNTDNTYRIYYSFSNGTNWSIRYRDTTDTNLPDKITGGNISPTEITLLGVSGTSYYSPWIERKPDNTYRVYFGTAGTYWSLAYRDTTDTNLPSNINLSGTQVATGIGGASGNQAQQILIKRKPDNTYRIYYNYIASFSVIAYRDTTDANLPDKITGGNISGTQTTLGIGNNTTSNRAEPNDIVQLETGYYRLYYRYYNGTYWQLAYVNTINTNLPQSGNITSQLLLGVGSASTNQALDARVIDKGDGTYRLYYSNYQNSTTLNYHLVYQDTNKIQPAWTTASKFSNALSFDGVDDYVDVGNAINPSGATGYTIEAWIKSSAGAVADAIAGWWDGTNGIFIQSKVASGEGLTVVAGGGTAYGEVNVDTHTNWVHAALVYDGTLSGNVNKLKLYVNGVQQTLTFAAGTVPASMPALTSSNFKIGDVGALNRKWAGSIDEVAVWNTALNARTISQHAGIDYIPASGETVTGPNNPIAGLTGYAFFAETATKPTNTFIDYQLSNNDGVDWCYYSGGWICDGADYSDAPTISTNISTFSTANSQIKVRARLNTTDATVRPELDNVSIGYLSPSAPLRLGSEQTIEAWVNVTSLGADWDRLIGKGVSGKENYGLWLQSDGDLKYQISNGGTTCSAWVDGGTAKITAGSGWRHIAGTRTGDTMKLYLDGAEKATAICSAVPSVSADPLIMGYDSGITGGDYFNGKIDEAAVYNAVLPATGAGSIQEHYLRGIVEDYKTVEVSGVVAANDGTTYGPITTAGKAGLNDALSFDGADDYMDIPYNASLDLNGEATIEAWVYLDVGGNRFIFEKTVGGTVNTGYSLFFEGTATTFRIHNGTSYTDLDYNALPSLGAWHHIAGVNSVSGGYRKIYIDGQEVATGASSAMRTGNGISRIGAHASNGYFFDGSIDEVAVWNTALDAAIIEQHAAFDYSAASGATVINKFSVPTDLGQITKWLSFSDVKTTFSNDYVEYQISNNYSDDGNDTNDTWCNYNTGTSSWQCSNANSVFSAVAAIDTGLKAGGFEVGNGMTVKARLNASSDGKYAPVLDAVEVGYPLSGYYRLISSPYNSNNPKNQIAKIQWLEDLPGPAGVSNVFVQIRSAPDNGSGSPGIWTSFLGPKTTTFSSGGCPASCPSVMTVANASGFSANQRVILTDASGSLEEIKTIQSVSGNDITVTSPLKNNYSAGSLLSAFYDDPYGGELINAVYTDGADDQWFQYRVILNTSDTSYSPTFSSIRIQYEP